MFSMAENIRPSTGAEGNYRREEEDWRVQEWGGQYWQDEVGGLESWNRTSIGGIHRGRSREGGEHEISLLLSSLQLVSTLLVTNGCVKSLVRGSHVDTESGGRIGHIEDGDQLPSWGSWVRRVRLVCSN